MLGEAALGMKRGRRCGDGGQLQYGRGITAQSWMLCAGITQTERQPRTLADRGSTTAIHRSSGYQAQPASPSIP